MLSLLRPIAASGGRWSLLREVEREIQPPFANQCGARQALCHRAATESHHRRGLIPSLMPLNGGLTPDGRRRVQRSLPDQPKEESSCSPCQIGRASCRERV